MGLITKPPSWSICTTNLSTTPTTLPGTNVQAGAGNADGSTVSLIANLSHDVEYLEIGAHGYTSTTEDSSTLLDILIDPAGGSSWSTDPIINDLLVGYSVSPAVQISIPIWYRFPIWLKSGCSIGARARSARATDQDGSVIVFAHGGNANPASWWCGQSVTSIGITAASSKGTNHTAGNTGAYSSWTNLGSTLPAPCGALHFAVHGTNSDTTALSASYLFEFGVGSTRIGPPILRKTTNTEAGWMWHGGPLFCSLPTGTQLQVRGSCNATAEILDVAAYAIH